MKKKKNQGRKNCIVENWKRKKIIGLTTTNKKKHKKKNSGRVAFTKKTFLVVITCKLVF